MAADNRDISISRQFHDMLGRDYDAQEGASPDLGQGRKFGR
jgi:hypothetical protein